MKKNYFKFLMAIAMMLGGVSLTSCDEMLDNPVEEPTEQTEEPKIVETETGAEITINALSDISGLLGELTPMIEAKNGEEFVLDVKSNGSLKVTETDNIILVPNVAGCNLVINFDNSLVSDGSAVTMKLDSKAATRAMVDESGVVYDKNVALNLKNTNTDLILDVPGVTVTVSTLNSIQILNGLSIVKEGASINTYVYAPKSNDVALYNGAAEDVQVNWINDETGEKEGWGTFPAVRSLKEWEYHFKNIKVIKGKADYARINAGNEAYKLEKLTIAEGLTVVLNYSPYIKEIVGEGNGAILKSSDVWWEDYEKKTVATEINLKGVDKISNITIEPLLDGDYKEGKLERSSIFYTPADIENVTFKMGYVAFRNPNATSAAVKNCKFESDVNVRRVEIAIPGQTETINAFKFNFENCEFSENVIFYNYIVTSKPKLDANGKVVYEDVYHWVVYDEAGNYMYETSSNNEANIPESTKAVGLLENGSWIYNEETESWEAPKGYWINQEIVYEEITFKDFYATISFKDCKYAGKTMTAESFHFNNSWLPTGAYLRYEFDGKVYRAIQMYDPEKEGDKYTWMLVEVND